MSTKKPALPPVGHIEIATAVTTALAGASRDDIESLPAKVRDSLDYFTEVFEVDQAVKIAQSRALADAGYRDDAVAFLLDHFPAQYDPDMGEDERQHLAEEQARAAADALLSSHLLARLLADVAAGNIEPVATVAKAAKSEPKKAPAEPKPAKPAPPVEPEPTPEPVEDDPFDTASTSEPVPPARKPRGPRAAVPQPPPSWQRTPAEDEEDDDF